jgi:hypothetical protein
MAFLHVASFSGGRGLCSDVRSADHGAAAGQEPLARGDRTGSLLARVSQPACGDAESANDASGALLTEAVAAEAAALGSRRQRPGGVRRRLHLVTSGLRLEEWKVPRCLAPLHHPSLLHCEPSARSPFLSCVLSAPSTISPRCRARKVEALHSWPSGSWEVAKRNALPARLPTRHGLSSPHGGRPTPAWMPMPRPWPPASVRGSR